MVPPIKTCLAQIRILGGGDHWDLVDLKASLHSASLRIVWDRWPAFWSNGMFYEYYTACMWMFCGFPKVICKRLELSVSFFRIEFSNSPQSSFMISLRSSQTSLVETTCWGTRTLVFCSINLLIIKVSCSWLTPQVPLAPPFFLNHEA